MNTGKLVCICSAYYYPHFGGVEMYAENMAKYLVKEGHKVVILTSCSGTKPGKELRDQVIIYRLPVMMIFKDRYPLPAFFSREFRRIIIELRAYDFSLFVMNTRFYITTVAGLILAGKGNKDAIIIEHGTGHMKLGNFLFDKAGAVYEHVLTWSLKTFFKPSFYGVSEACNRWLAHFGIKATGVIYNGIDTGHVGIGKINYRESFNLPEDSVVFTFAGRLILEKGILFILDLFSDFIKKHNNAFLFIAGSGPLYEEAKTYGNDHIILLGKLDHSDVMSLLSATDVVLIPSDYPEGLPTLILEGGLSKCAVIATDRGGSKEVISEPKLGYIFPDPDREKFFTAMEELMVNTEHRKALQENLHQVVISKFSWEAIIRDVVRMLD